MQTFQQMPFLGLDNQPAKGQGALLVEHTDDQSHAVSADLTAIDDQQQRTFRQAGEQCLNIREVVLLDRDGLVFEKAFLTGDAALTLGFGEHFAGNGGQLGFVTADDTADEGGQGEQMA